MPDAKNWVVVVGDTIEMTVYGPMSHERAVALGRDIEGSGEVFTISELTDIDEPSCKTCGDGGCPSCEDEG